MTPQEAKLVAAAQAEDTLDLLNHIAWTDVIRPALATRMSNLSKILVSHLLGTPLPQGLTKEQIAGQIYGIQEIISLFERVLVHGKKALEDLSSQGISLI